MKNQLMTGIICCFFIVQTSALPRFPDLKFTLLNKSNGLPTNLITSVFKDSRGLVWLGTKDAGLLRYDGKKVKQYYKPNGGNNYISTAYTHTVVEDKGGWLWISSNAGLYHLNPVTDSIELYRHNNADTNSIITSNTPWPFIDSRGRLWVGSYAGLQMFQSATKKFINYTKPPISNPAWQDQSTTVNCVYEDAQHRLWTGSAYGLYSIDTNHHTLTPFYADIYNVTTSVYQDWNNEIWVGFWGGGLKKFDPQTGRYKDYFAANTITTAITGWKDENGYRWLCFSDFNSLILMDPATGEYKHYLSDILNPVSIKGTYIDYIYQDDEGRLWVCTSAGINIIDPQLQHFTNHLLYTDVNSNDPMAYGSPKAMFTTQEEIIIANWYQANVYYYNRQWKLRKIVESIPPQSTSPLSKSIYTMQKDEEGNMWYGTDSGLVKQNGNTYKVYLPTDTFVKVEGRYSARNMIKRKDGLYWVRFRKRGLYLFDAAKERFLKNYHRQYKGVTSGMQQDREGNLWLSTDSGMYVYDEPLDSFVHFPVIRGKAETVPFDNEINGFYFDDTNTCWIATYNGLIKFDVRKQQFELISDASGPGNKELYTILEDSTGTIWCETVTGLTAYNKHRKTFHYFSADHGLPQGFIAFNGVFSWLDDSTIAMGSGGIITTFNPYRIIRSGQHYTIRFTDISVDGKRRDANVDGKDSLTVIVEADAQNINVHFSYLNYTAPQQNRLYYRLLADKNNAWIETAEGDIALLGLPEGEYIVEVKGVSNGDVLNTSFSRLKLIVNPHWYQTPAVKIAGLSLLIAFIYLFIKWRIKSVKTSAAQKQLITETEMAALKAQMNPHFMFNCINSIDAFIQTNDKYNATLYLNKFARLIRNVLDSSKQNIVPFTKDIETLKLYIELEELRSETKFVTQLNIDEELMNNDYQVPPLIIQPFVENAIIHGLRNREGDGGLLTILISKNESHIIYYISDNGIGRLAAGKINTGKEKSYGMQMSYDRIKMFNKEAIASVGISNLYENEMNTGTRVIVHLKKW